MSNAKVNILSRLKKSIFNNNVLQHNDYDTLYSNILNTKKVFNNKLDRLKDLLINVHNAKVYDTTNDNIVKDTQDILQKKKIKTLLYSEKTDIGKKLSLAMSKSDIELVSYPDNINNFKEKLFSIDASITTTVGGIADTGTLIICPTKEEPRSMSLVPPIHIAILDSKNIYNTFLEAIENADWTNTTNIVLVSGPSKTADIEFVLTHGVHGPKELIVFLLSN